jgi:glutaredoxin 2
MKKLYHYVHCPYCVRVRFVLGLLKIPYDSIVLRYDDEKTPVNLTGVKMLPILDFENGENKNESLEIIRQLDNKNTLSLDLLLNSEKLLEVETLLDSIGKSVHALCMPYWIYTPEFDEKSRHYFQEKKGKKKGPFFRLIKNKDSYLKSLSSTLYTIEKQIKPYWEGQNLSIFDIMIASHLWGMYIFPEFQFPLNIHEYLQNIKSQCEFDYHEDFWRSEKPCFNKD